MVYKIKTGVVRPIGLSCLLLLSAFFSTTLTAEKSVTDVPCWLDEPVTDTQTGQIGIANAISARTTNTREISRKRAVRKLLHYLDIGIDDNAINDADLEEFYRSDSLPTSVNVDGQLITLVEDFSYRGEIYSYVIAGGLEKSKGDLSKSCPPKKCDLNICSPAWLCNPSSARAGFTGTSYQSYSMRKQRELAFNQAIQQAKTLYGVEISTNDRIISGRSGSQSIRIIKNNDTLNYASHSNQQNIRFINHASCSIGSQLFMHVESPDLEPINETPASTWLSNPNCCGHTGAIGVVELDMGSGLLSDKLELSIRRALIALAKSINVEISEELVTFQRTKGNHYLISVLKQNSRATLNARVNGIHYKPHHSGVAVYTWVVQEFDSLNKKGTPHETQ